jgi:hypothetical protein
MRQVGAGQQREVPLKFSGCVILLITNESWRCAHQACSAETDEMSSSFK